MSKPQPAMIGLFIIGAVIIGIVGVFAFGGARWLEPSARAVLYFEEPVGGLTAGSGVNFRGVRIGEVDRVTLDINSITGEAITPVYIRITPGDIFEQSSLGSLEEAVARWIDQGLSGQLQNTNLLTGQLAISIDFRPDATPSIQDRPDVDLPQIPVVASQVEQFREAFTELDWRNIVTQFEDTMTSINDLTDLLQEELTGTSEKLDRTVTAAEDLMAEARLTLQSIRNDTQQALQAFSELGQTTQDSVSRLERQADATLSSFEDLAVGAERTVQTAGEDLTQLLAQTETTLETIDTIGQQLSALTHPRSAERDDLQRTLRDLAAASATLRRFATLIENNPNALFFGATEDGE